MPSSQVAVYLDGVRVSTGEVDLVSLNLLGGVEFYSPAFVPVEPGTTATVPEVIAGAPGGMSRER
jgi:hypothetical protein